MLRVRQSKNQFKAVPINEIDARMASIQSAIVDSLTERIKDAVVSRIPALTKMQRIYRDGITASAIRGIRGKRSGAAILSNAPASMETVDASKTLVIFPRKDTTGDQGAAVLATEEPWAVDQLPPIEITAPVVFRVVTEREVNQVRSANAKSLPYVMRLLSESKVELIAHVVIRGTPQIDLNNYAMRMEFGLPGAPHVPHWRPALSYGRRKAFLDMQADTEFMGQILDTILNGAYSGWKRPLVPLDGTVSVKQLQGAQGFMKAFR